MAYTRGTYLAPDNTKHFVAVYGSLRLGQSNERLNKDAKAVYVGSGKTTKNYDLSRYQASYFPCISLVHNSADQQVVVDVFEVTGEGLKGPYDRLEGYPDFYNRTEIPITMDNGEIVKAWIYHIDEEMPTLVAGGDWVVYLKEEAAASTDPYSNLT